MAPQRFSFRALPLPVAADSSGAKELLDEDESTELRAFINGDFSTLAHVRRDLRQHAVGSCPVPSDQNAMLVISYKKIMFCKITRLDFYYPT